MGIRTVSITRALIKYLLVRGISTRGHGRHQSSRLDAGVHPSAVDNPEAAGLHRFPDPSPRRRHEKCIAGRVHTTCTSRGWPTDRVGNMQPDACTQTADWNYVRAGPGCPSHTHFPHLLLVDEGEIIQVSQKGGNTRKRGEGLLGNNLVKKEYIERGEKCSFACARRPAAKLHV